MRPEQLYLQDIVEAASSIGRFLEGVAKHRFMTDDLVSSAVLQKLSIIGEAASRIPASTRNAYSYIDWREITAFRNILVHAYFAIDLDLIWTAATREVPELARQVREILDKDYST